MHALLVITLITSRFGDRQEVSHALLDSAKIAHGDMSDLSILLSSLELHQPFMYAHFNDGEILALKSSRGTTDRGRQPMSSELQKALSKAICTDMKGMYFGLPCALEFPGARQIALHATQQLQHTQLTTATLFLNGNYVLARSTLLSILPTRPVHIVVSDNADIMRFQQKTRIIPTKIYRVASTDAFHKDYQHILKSIALLPGEIVILCCGPMGRVLAVDLFQRFPQSTVLELGSFFDRDLYSKPTGPTYYTGQHTTSCNYQGDIAVSSSGQHSEHILVQLLTRFVCAFAVLYILYQVTCVSRVVPGL